MSSDHKGRRDRSDRRGRKGLLDRKACKGPLDRRDHKAPPDHKAQAVHLPQVTMDALGNNKLHQIVNRSILIQASPLDRRS
jgi:hypothetical protein